MCGTYTKKKRTKWKRTEGRASVYNTHFVLYGNQDWIWKHISWNFTSKTPPRNPNLCKTDGYTTYAMHVFYQKFYFRFVRGAWVLGGGVCVNSRLFLFFPLYSRKYSIMRRKGFHTLSICLLFTVCNVWVHTPQILQIDCPRTQFSRIQPHNVRAAFNIECNKKPTISHWFYE